jgi:hypothetical protein
MSFTLELVFVGLVAFVYDPANPPRIDALLLDVTKPYVASDGRTIPSHKPLIIYCCDNLPQGCKQGDDWNIEAVAYFYDILHGDAPPPPSGTSAYTCKTGYGARALDGVAISLDPTNVKETSLAIDPTFNNDVAYVPEFNSGIPPTTAKIDPGFKTLKPPYNNLLAARAVFTKTKDVRVSSYVHGKKKYRFATLHDSTTIIGSKQIAEETVFDFTIDTTTINTAKIDLSSFRGGSSMQPLTLTPAKTQTTPVLVFIVNIVDCDLWLQYPSGDWYCEDGATLDYDRGNHHFEAYYELANIRPPERQRPVPFYDTMQKAVSAQHPMTRAERSMFYLLNRPMCPPAQLAP